MSFLTTERRKTWKRNSSSANLKAEVWLDLYLARLFRLRIFTSFYWLWFDFGCNGEVRWGELLVWLAQVHLQNGGHSEGPRELGTRALSEMSAGNGRKIREANYHKWWKAHKWSGRAKSANCQRSSSYDSMELPGETIREWFCCFWLECVWVFLFGRLTTFWQAIICTSG